MMMYVYYIHACRHNYVSFDPFSKVYGDCNFSVLLQSLSEDPCKVPTGAYGCRGIGHVYHNFGQNLLIPRPNFRFYICLSVPRGVKAHQCKLLVSKPVYIILATVLIPHARSIKYYGLLMQCSTMEN